MLLHQTANNAIVNNELQLQHLGTTQVAITTLGQALGREERKWLTRKEAANFLTDIGCPVTAERLARLASNDNAGKGPAFSRIRWRIVRYQPIDLRKWAAENIVRVE